MVKIENIFATLFFTLITIHSYSQNADFVDPGNARGDEGTIYLWEKPTIYIPVVVIVIVVVAIGIMRKKKKS